MKPRTRRVYRNRVEQLCDQKDANGNAYGDKSAATLQREHVTKMMAALAGKPESANLLRKVLRAMMQHAVDAGIRVDDPTRDVKAIKSKGSGAHSWSETEIAQFETHHPIGTRPRLAMALLLYTGQRRGDVVGMGCQHVGRHVGEDGIARDMISVRQEKTGAALDIPLHSDLAAIIAATQSEHLTYLTTQFGKPFTSAGFGNWFREQCDAAGLSHCSAHGLRKAAARRLAEAGCSAHEIAAITGHASLREIVRYTKAADQKRLAVSAMAKVKARTASG
jgi:integrase